MQIHIAAKEVARRADMHCMVDGPVMRELCIKLFTHPNMQKAFRTWSSRKKPEARLAAGLLKIDAGDGT